MGQHSNAPLKARDLRAGDWVGSLYRLNRDWFGLKVKDFPPITIRFEDLMRLLQGEAVAERAKEVASAPPAPKE